MRGPEIQATPDQSLSGQTSLNTTVTLSGRPTDSLTNLPRWTLPLSKLTPLTSLVEQPKNQRRPRTRQSQQDDDRRRVSVVCCVMSVESPIQFQKRNQGYSTGWRASWQVSVPSNSDKNAPASCEVMLWDDCARDWGGSVRKGDVVFLQGEHTARLTDRRCQLLTSSRGERSSNHHLTTQLRGGSRRSLPHTPSVHRGSRQVRLRVWFG